MRSDAWNPHSTDKVHKVDVRAFTSRPLELSILRHMRMMGVLSPSTEGGHDYTTRSNNRRMHQPRLSSEDHGENELHPSWLLGLSHKTWKISRIPPRSVFPKVSGLVTFSYHHRSSLVWRWDVVVIFTKLSRSLIPIFKGIKQCGNGAVAKPSGCVPTSLDIASQSDPFLMELRGR